MVPRQLTSGAGVTSDVLSGNGVIAYAATAGNRLLRVNTVNVTVRIFPHLEESLSRCRIPAFLAAGGGRSNSGPSTTGRLGHRRAQRSGGFPHPLGRADRATGSDYGRERLAVRPRLLHRRGAGRQSASLVRAADSPGLLRCGEAGVARQTR